MAGIAGRGYRSRQTIAVILVLCSLSPSLTCFSLQGLSKKVKHERVVSEATVMEVRTGSILFNGKELNSAAATGNDGLLHIDLDQSDGAGMLGQTSQMEDAMANEAAWRRLNPSLHCGQNKMKFKARGPGAADLQLDMGNDHPLPLIQVPETCGYSILQNALGIVLVVPYDGCNVIQENGNYLLLMSWLKTPVKFTCPMLSSSATTPASTIPKPAQLPWKLPFPQRPWNLNRRKRHTKQPLSIYDPNSPYNPYLYYYDYMYMMTLAPAPDTATATAKPETTPITTKPSTEKPPQKKPPAYPSNPYYPHYPHYNYYPYYPYYPLPNLPVKTTAPPATTTAKPTTGPATTAPALTTQTPQKPSNPYYPPYFPYPYYPPAGQPLPGMADNSEIYYYPVIQHFYGKPPYPQNPNQPMQTTLPQTPTTAKPDDTAPTTKPSDSSPTTKPTTASAPTTTKACSHTTKPSSGSYPGPMSPYVPYYQLPFAPYISYKHNKAGKLPDDEKYMPQAGYKSGLQARAHPHPGFHYWQPAPWFPHSTGQNNPQFDWKNLQPKQI